MVVTEPEDTYSQTFIRILHKSFPWRAARLHTFAVRHSGPEFIRANRIYF